MNRTVTVDVRDEIRAGREPLSKIMSTVAALQTDENLLVIAPFEPVPLFGLMENQGFSHKAQPNESGGWEVLFTRRPAGPALEPDVPGHHDGIGVTPGKVLRVDARGLEPPQPMVKILETLAELADGGQLIAHTDRRPMHLYAQLEERGFIAETQEQPDGSFLTHVRRP